MLHQYKDTNRTKRITGAEKGSKIQQEKNNATKQIKSCNQTSCHKCSIFNKAMNSMKTIRKDTKIQGREDLKTERDKAQGSKIEERN